MNDIERNMYIKIAMNQVLSNNWKEVTDIEEAYLEGDKKMLPEKMYPILSDIGKQCIVHLAQDLIVLHNVIVKGGYDKKPQNDDSDQLSQHEKDAYDENIENKNCDIDTQDLI